MPDEPAAPRQGQLRQSLPAVGAYAATRLVGLAMLAVLANREGRSLMGLLTNWDAGWYVNLATNGYDTTISYVGDQLVRTNVAFFPLFPALIRVVSALGVSPWLAGVIIANLSGLAAAWGMALIGTKLYSARTGLVLAVIWGALPHAVVQSMSYSESLFTALCAWALWACLDKRYLLAGGLAAMAGLTRPTSVALVAAVVVTVVVAIIRGRAPWRHGGWSLWVGGLLAPVGLIGYLVWCAVVLGRADAYFWMQDIGWDTRIDYGATTVHELGVVATSAQPLAMYVTSLVIIVAVALLIMLAVDTAHRPALVPLLIFAGLLVLTVLMQGGNYFYAKARFLLPAFPLLLPIALGLAAAQRHVRAIILGLLILVSGFYGGYLTITWHLSP